MTFTRFIGFRMLKVSAATGSGVGGKSGESESNGNASSSVAVVIPCRNEAERIEALLDALAGQSRRPSEIVIVNDRSTDDTTAVIGQWIATHSDLAAQLVEGSGRGPAAAMNDGIRESTADVVVRMDGHAIPARNYLERCLDILQRPEGVGPSVGVVGGVWQVQPGAPTATARAIAATVSHPLGSGGAAYRSSRADDALCLDVETVPFGTFPRSVWEQVGGYDETLVANEDFDFNYRVRRAGYRVVLCPHIQTMYFARSTFRALACQYFRYGFWKARMLRKDDRSLHPRQVPPALILPWVLASITWLVTSPSALSAIVACAYPLTLVIAALTVAVSRRVHPLGVVAAAVCVHLAWSAGFWRGAASRRSP
jgi:glycosyltransferase involved in cell wall biosynthesis